MYRSQTILLEVWAANTGSQQSGKCGWSWPYNAAFELSYGRYLTRKLIPTGPDFANKLKSTNWLKYTNLLKVKSTIFSRFHKQTQTQWQSQLCLLSLLILDCLYPVLSLVFILNVEKKAAFLFT